MAPPSTIKVRERIELVKAFMRHFTTMQFPEYTSEVWKDMSRHVDGKWKPHVVYTNVREDRQRIRSIAREEMGIAILEDYEVPKHQGNGKSVLFQTSKQIFYCKISLFINVVSVYNIQNSLFYS